MVLRLGPQVLEDDLFHEALHEVPVLHNPVTDRPLESERFKVIRPSLREHQVKEKKKQQTSHVCFRFCSTTLLGFGSVP